MSAAPAMPIFPDAYLADTTHLTTEEHGVYLLLLMAMWRRNGTVPNDDKDLARIVGLSVSKWMKTKARLSSFLIIGDDEISQKRLKKEWDYCQEIREKNARNGAKGGRPAYNKNNDIAKANGSVSVNPNESPLTHTLTHIVKEEDKSSSKNPHEKSEIDLFIEAYSVMAAQVGLAVPRAVTASRRQRIGAKIRAHGLDVCFEAIRRVGQSSFCTGSNDRGWRADLDFVLQDKSFLGLIEGKYENRVGVHRSNAPPQQPMMADLTGHLLRQMRENRDIHDEPDSFAGPTIEAGATGGNHGTSTSAVLKPSSKGW